MEKIKITNVILNTAEAHYKDDFKMQIWFEVLTKLEHGMYKN